MKATRLLHRLVSRLSADPRSLKPVERLRSVARGALNPIVLRATHDPKYDAASTLIVAGFPRSGTTWLAETLAILPGTGILFEPLDIRKVRAAREAGLDGENFFAHDAYWPEGERFVQNLLTGRILTPWTTSQITLAAAWRLDRWIVKMVRANLMLGWIVANFRLPPPVLLVRHPCAVYDSWIRRGWPIRQHPPGLDLRFFGTYPHLRGIVEELKTPEEYFAAMWSMQHFAPLRQLQRGTYQLCYYEHLRSDGLSEVKKMLHRWGLDVPIGLEDNLKRPSAKASGHSHDGPRGWRTRVDRGVAERIASVLDRFELGLYTREGEPVE